MADVKGKSRGEIEALKKAYYNEEVPVTLIKDNDRYKDDVTVTLNGVNTVIQRGIPVMVKRCVAEVLECSNLQNNIAAGMMQELSN